MASVKKYEDLVKRFLNDFDELEQPPKSGADVKVAMLKLILAAISLIRQERTENRPALRHIFYALGILQNRLDGD